MANARMIAAAAEAREGNICIFDSVLDEVALRELVNMLSEKCTGYAAAFPAAMRRAGDTSSAAAMLTCEKWQRKSILPSAARAAERLR